MEPTKANTNGETLAPIITEEEVAKYDKLVDVPMVRKGSDDKTLHRAVNIFPEFDMKSGFGNGRGKLRFLVERYKEERISEDVVRKNVVNSFLMDCKNYAAEFVAAPM